MNDIDWFALLLHPATLGFLAGLVLAFFIWNGARAAKSNLKRENKRLDKEISELQSHLNTQLKINASGNKNMEKEIQDLKETNENLRVNISALQNKPGKFEVRQLHLMERAIGLMREQAPGFAQAWEQALRQAEAEQEAAEGGLRKLVRRVLPSIGTNQGAHAEDMEDTSQVSEKTEKS